jgi:hypothetical protein
MSRCMLAVGFGGAQALPRSAVRAAGVSPRAQLSETPQDARTYADGPRDRAGTVP